MISKTVYSSVKMRIMIVPISLGYSARLNENVCEGPNTE